MINEDSTLSEILEYYGFKHYKGKFYRRDIFYKDDYIGRMNCHECTEWLINICLFPHNKDKLNENKN